MTLTTQTASVGASASLAEFAAKLRPQDLPTEVIEQAKMCILDALGIALAAATYPYARQAIAAAYDLGGAGQAPVFGRVGGLTLRDAVFANGTLIHSLDFDDTHTRSVVHCTASAWPVAFNVAHQLGLSGRDALTAFALAVEVDARIGELAEGRLQARGFHPTGIVGAFGCAAAYSWLNRLSSVEHLNALGIVLSMASGSMAFINDGAWTKRIHPGWAGVAGITAGALAKAEFIGPKAPLEGRFGLLDSLLGEIPTTKLAEFANDLGRAWRLPEVGFKPYPACHFNHAFADCALAIKQSESLDLSGIKLITALIHPAQVDIVCEPADAKRRPANAYEAQFSVPYIVAATLVRGQFTLAELDDDALNDDEILRLAALVDYRDDPNSRYPEYFSGGLIVEMNDGQVHQLHRQTNRGSDAEPLSAAQIMSKYLANATKSVTLSHAERIADIVLGLDTATNLDELAAALTSETVAPTLG